MESNISQSKHKDIDAVEMENDQLQAVFLMECGGKMASLRYKKTNREFLVQAGCEEYKKPAYDGVYIDSECSGFDDIFPTIDVWT